MGNRPDLLLNASVGHRGEGVSGADILADIERRRRPDPRTVLLVVLVLNALAMSRAGMTTILVVNLVAVGALMYARAWRWTASFVGVQMLWLTLVFVLPQLWTSAVSAFFVVIGYWMIKLTTAAGVAAYAVKTIVPGELIAAFRRMRIPNAITVPAVVLLRFMPTVVSEYQAVREAMALRGLQMGWKAVFQPLRYLEYMLVPLLTSCSRIADELTAAGMVRGLGSPISPTTLKRLHFGVPDLAFLIVVAAVLAATPLTNSISLVAGGFK